VIIATVSRDAARHISEPLSFSRSYIVPLRREPSRTARSSPKAAVVITFETRAESHLLSLICCFNTSRMARAT
jgi:hypothetical protein